MAGLSVTYDLTRNLHVNVHASLFFDEYAYGYKDTFWDKNKRRDREFNISPKIKLDLFKCLTLDLSYTYIHLDSNYSLAEHEDHTVLLRATLFR